MTCFTTAFAQFDQLELYETVFYHPLVEDECRTIRGKTSGAYRHWGTFQWTKAVKAVCLLAVRTALCYRRHNGKDNVYPVLLGQKTSLAASLDYAITKRPSWMLDMFGVDKKGKPIVQRLFYRNNSNQKRYGPVTVAFNTVILPPESFSIIVNGQQINDIEGLVRLDSLLSSDFSQQECETDRGSVETYMMKRCA